MIIILKEFYERINPLGLTRLQLPYLFATDLIPGPIRIQRANEWIEYLFDESHIAALEKILAETESSTEQLCERATSFIGEISLDQAPGLSQSVEEMLMSEINNPEGKAHDVRIPSRDVVSVISRLGQKQSEKPGKVRTLFRHLLNYFRPTLTGFEQLVFTAEQMVVSLKVRSELNVLFFSRFRPINESSPYDLCFREYVNAESMFGWGRIDDEIKLVNTLRRHEPSLDKWPLKESFAFLNRITDEYDHMAQFARDYRARLDPEGRIATLMVMRALIPIIEKKFAKANEGARRRRQRLTRIVQQMVDLLGKLPHEYPKSSF